MCAVRYRVQFVPDELLGQGTARALGKLGNSGAHVVAGFKGLFPPAVLAYALVICPNAQHPGAVGEECRAGYPGKDTDTGLLCAFPQPLHQAAE